MTDEELVLAVRRRLGISDDPDPGRSQRSWAQLLADEGLRQRVRDVAQRLGKALEQAVRRQLGLTVGNDVPSEELDSLFKAFVGWLRQDQMKRSPLVSRLIHKAATENKPKGPPAARPTQQAASAPPPPARPAPAPPKPSPDSPPPDPPPAAKLEEPVTSGPAKPADPPAPSGPLWKYLPVPADEPDPHAEADCRAATSPEGWPILGARVRGKKHKHDGTHCDDWFELAAAGCWTLIAVADGAGSKKFSRVGARASCQAALARLTADLREHRLEEREWSKEALRRDEQTGAYDAPDVERVQQALHRAMADALEAVKQAAGERADSPEHERVLNRKLTLNDLSATLLLAVHTRIRFRDRDYSFALACHIGDGMTAAVGADGTVVALASPDSGEFSGETDFLTSEHKLAPDRLGRKTYLMFRPARALLVMTDGVADDYFPADPEVLRLYADLALNGVLDVAEVSAEEQAAALAATRLPTPDDLQRAEIETTVDAVTPDGPKPARLRSAAWYAEKLGVPVAELALSAPLLRAGRAPDTSATPAERLRDWLDAYYVRSSFDDRTLVVLHCQAPAPAAGQISNPSGEQPAAAPPKEADEVPS